MVGDVNVFQGFTWIRSIPDPSGSATASLAVEPRGRPILLLEAEAFDPPFDLGRIDLLPADLEDGRDIPKVPFRARIPVVLELRVRQPTSADQGPGRCPG